jgi:hypothetical protein
MTAANVGTAEPLDAGVGQIVAAAFLASIRSLPLGVGIEATFIGSVATGS